MPTGSAPSAASGSSRWYCGSDSAPCSAFAARLRARRTERKNVSQASVNEVAGVVDTSRRLARLMIASTKESGDRYGPLMPHTAVSRLSGGPLRAEVAVGDHVVVADEPESLGGTDTA